MALSSKVVILAAACGVLATLAAGSPQLGLGGYYSGGFSGLGGLGGLGGGLGGHGGGYGHSTTYQYSSLGDDPHGLVHGKYNYKYGVHDTHTGDIKSASESGHGGLVKGEYSLVQPDGVTRTVHYTADKHSGFNAVVHNSKPHHHY